MQNKGSPTHHSCNCLETEIAVDMMWGAFSMRFYVLGWNVDSKKKKKILTQTSQSKAFSFGERERRKNGELQEAEFHPHSLRRGSKGEGGKYP